MKHRRPGLAYRRRRAAICLLLGKWPHEFDEVADQGKLSVGDGRDLISAAMADPKEAIWLGPFLFPEQMKELKEEKKAEEEEKLAVKHSKQIEGILNLIQTRDENEAQAKAELMERIKEKSRKA